MEREKLADDLDGLSLTGGFTGATSDGAIPCARERPSSNATRGDRGERRVSGSSNQVELIVADDPNRMANDDDNDHSFGPDQGAALRGARTGAGMEADEESERQTAEPIGGLLDERNEWGSMMQQIVESAESKLMRHRRLVAEQADEGKEEAEMQPASQQVGPGPQRDLECSVDVAASRKRSPSTGRIKTKLQLLKSPAFATNTLDDAELDKLATSATGQTVGQAQPGIVISDGCGPASVASDHYRRQQQQQRQIVTDCGRNSSASMINRRHKAEEPTQQDPSSSISGTGAAVRGVAAGSAANTGLLSLVNPSGEQVEAAEQTRIPGAQSTSPVRRAQRHCRRPEDVDAEEERGGPTPTNDLIRTLIHRDRLALALGGGQQQQQGEHAQQLTELPNKPGTGHSKESIVAGRRVVSCAGATQAGGGPNDGQEEDATTMIRAEMGPEPNLTSGAAHNNDTTGGAHCCYRASGHQDDDHDDNRAPSCKTCPSTGSTGQGSTECSSTQLRTPQPGALIGQQLPSAAAQRQTPYRSPGVGQAAATAAQETSSAVCPPGGRQPYLFPALLKKRSPASVSGGDDDDDSDESTSGSLLSAATSTDLNLDDDECEPTGGARSQRDQVGQFALLANCRLRPSASSPSALSNTPTNERRGCGDACCRAGHQLAGSGQQRLLHNLMGHNKSPVTGTRHCTADNLAPRPGQHARKMSLWSASDFYGDHHQQQQPADRHRKRMGSNPLDRLCRLGGSGQRPNQWPSSSSTSGCSSGTSSKRHSIMSALTGGHQVSAQLVSRLAHPRSFFSSGANRRTTGDGSIESSIGSANQQHQQQEQYDPLIPEIGFKIVVMGTSGSGKTSIIQRFLYDSFSWRHTPTVEDTYFIEFPYMKNMINISISDTSGTYQFPAMRRLAINSGDAFILVYSVDDPKSFDDLEQLRQTILEERERAFSEAAASSSSSLASTSSAGSTSGLASGYSHAATSTGSCASVHQAAAAGAHHQGCCHLQQQQQQQQLQVQPSHDSAGPPDVSPVRHWSLASIFQYNQGGHQHNNLSGGKHENCQRHQSGSLHSSVGSFSAASSACSSADHSRRSSISAAEAALKTRRTRHPPMVIVANKSDLPEERHLVNSDEIEALVEIDWNNGFVRASAALNLNIEEIFQQVLKQARQPPTLTAAIVSKRRKSLPPKMPQCSMGTNSVS